MNKNSEIIYHIKPGNDRNLAEIILNRPDKLNALSFTMCQSLSKQLLQWAHEPSIKAVIIKGVGDRAFCAGGDIRSLYELRNTQSIDELRQFFAHEYLMNARLFHFPKPYIAFLDGITMGGGAGVSLHGSHQVATENFIFAMPEAGIGYFTDIGAGHFLNQCPYHIGYYLALTGEKINAADAKACQLVTHTISRENLAAINDELINATMKSDAAFDQVTKILDHFQTDVASTQVWNQRESIERCFKKKTVAEIFEALAKENTEFSQKTLHILKQRSPTSLKVILRYLQKAKSLSFNDLMRMEFDMTYHFLNGHDFFEGIRALLIDKDKQPKWDPNHIDSVADHVVENYFQPAEKRLTITT